MPETAPQIAITAFSDMDEKPERRRLWGDYWIKKRLEDEFTRQECRVHGPTNESGPDILIHLFGQPMQDLPDAPCRILWVHSHPDDLSESITKEYDKVLCASRPFAEKLASRGEETRWLMLPTHMKAMYRENPGEIKKDVIFVGNNRRGPMRGLMNDLMSIREDLKCRVNVWGDGWEGAIPDDWFAGREYPAERLNELYSSAKIILNDHHKDMAREGFLNPRILDGLAAGALVITDPVLGLDELFDIPVYHDARELLKQIEEYLADENGRENIVKSAGQKLKSFTYENTVRSILELCG